MIEVSENVIMIFVFQQVDVPKGSIETNIKCNIILLKIRSQSKEMNKWVTYEKKNPFKKNQQTTCFM